MIWKITLEVGEKYLSAKTFMDDFGMKPYKFRKRKGET